MATGTSAAPRADDQPGPAGPGRGRLLASAALTILALASLAVLGADGLRALAAGWRLPEYSHGPAVPLLVLYLALLRAPALTHAGPAGAWRGVFLAGAGIALTALAERTGFPAISQYGLVLAASGLAWAALGTGRFRAIAPLLALLVFMLPLPALVEARVIGGLQDLAAGIGVAVVRLAGYPAFRAGSLIDLGASRLLVAEACSGLRFVLPLLGVGALCGVLFRGSTWQRLLITFVALPVAVLMNGLRVGVTGILVNRLGPRQAEGFLHYFEGWLLFIACVLAMQGVIALLARLRGERVADLMAVHLPRPGDLRHALARCRPTAPAAAAAALALAAATAAVLVPPPVERVPPRARLDSLPRQFAGWQGEDLSAPTIRTVAAGVSDRLLVAFRRPGEAEPVELWVAWCDSQRAAPCAPSPGRILASTGLDLQSGGSRVLGARGRDGDGPLRVARVLLAREDSRQLVYYWFADRGRHLTSEVAREWFVLADGLRRHRTDGALVRVSTGAGPPPAAGDDPGLRAAERRLDAFVSAVLPELGPHLPD